MSKNLPVCVALAFLCVASVLMGDAAMQVQGGKLSSDNGNPFVVFTSAQQLREYSRQHKGDFFNLSARQCAKYTDEFFAESALVMFLTDGMSGSIKVKCEGYAFSDGKLLVTVRESSPPMHTMDLKYNVLTVAVPQDIARKITSVAIRSYRVDI